MTDIQIHFLSAPSAEQLRAIVALYRQAGWWPDQEREDYVRLARLVAQSHCFAVAMAGEEMVGMGRAISDGVSDAYVQDVTVASDWRRLGVGKRIVCSILERLQGDGLTWIGLIAEKGSAPLYRQLGFEKMTDAHPMLLTR